MGAKHYQLSPNCCKAYAWQGKKPCPWRCWEENSECRIDYEEEKEEQVDCFECGATWKHDCQC